MKKIEDVIMFHKHKSIEDKEAVVLLDMNNTLWNIKTYIKNKYPTLNIEIVNEGMGDR
jgi:hypothetical protein